MALVEVEGLEIAFGGTTVVHGVDLRVDPGEVVALVGESGSGKSVTARSLLGLAGARARVRADRLRVVGEEVLTLGERRLRRFRGRHVGLIAQDAFASLDPLRPVGREIEDALRLHTALPPVARRARVLELLDRVGVPDPALRAGQRPHELSGGLRQRALIAAALAGEPELLIADEPTTALDATIQVGILELLAALARDGAGVLLISHDLAMVSRLADRVAVMRGGRIVEEGATRAVIDHGRHVYTRQLLAAVPTKRPRHTSLQPRATATSEPAGTRTGVRAGVGAPPRLAEPVLEGRELSASFALPGGRRLLAVGGVSFALPAGRTLGVVGESGSGKSTLARLALGLLAPDEGEVLLRGEPWNPGRESERRGRRPELGAIAQDPLGSLDPRWTVAETLADALSAGRHGPRALRKEVAELLDRVGLSPAVAARRPRTLSAGQRQRVAIARAVAPRPRLLIADEPVSSLDASVQAQVLDLLDELQRELGLAILLISHDLGVMRHSSDEVLVLHRGRVVEAGRTEEVFAAPATDYARELVAAAPRLRREAGPGRIDGDEGE